MADNTNAVKSTKKSGNVTETRVPIQETYTIPSNGALYNGEIPDAITMRAMTTLDEKIRLSSNGFMSVVNLINSCVVYPEEFDARNLKMFDMQYLLYMLRVITYGSEYKVNVFCDECDKTCEVNVDLDTIPVVNVPDDFKEPFEIGPLPKSGDIVSCKILTVGDLVEMEKEKSRILSKFKDYVGDPEFVLTYKHMIVNVNGEVLPDYKKQQYVESMNAMDLRYLDSVYDKLANGYGMNTIIETECPYCGAPMQFDLPINDEFFRPRFNL